MDAPRILAIDDVHLTAGSNRAEEVCSFYTELIGLDRLPGQSSEQVLIFRGHPRSGPRLVVRLVEDLPEKLPRRSLLIQAASLNACAEALLEKRIDFEWSRGWFWYDRRLCTLDPGGNRVELVASHSW